MATTQGFKKNIKSSLFLQNWQLLSNCSSFPWFTQLVFSDCNSFPWFTQLCRSRSLDLHNSVVNSFPRFTQLCRSLGLQFVSSIYTTLSFSQIAIRSLGNELCKSRTWIAIREHEGNKQLFLFFLNPHIPEELMTISTKFFQLNGIYVYTNGEPYVPLQE